MTREDKMSKKIDEKRIEQLLDDAAQCWENMGLSFGTRMYHEGEDGWCAIIHPLPVEIDGERVEGVGEGCINLLGIIGLFDDDIEDARMLLRGTTDEIWVAGKIDGESVRLELWLYVPEGEEVVDQIRSSPHKCGEPQEAQ
jgi:hypothetical protein